MMPTKSDRLLDALATVEALQAKFKHDLTEDISGNLHMVKVGLEREAADQLLRERRRSVTETPSMCLDPLRHGGHPAADRGASEAGCYG